MKPIISVEGLGKSYTIRHEGQPHYKSLREEIFKLPKRLFSRGRQSQEEFWALRDANFDIMPGDRVGIIGRNGAGKSTLLKLLSRITEPTTGRITLRGRVASLLEVGTGFHPELSGRENIFLNGAILGMSRTEVHRKFDEIVDFSGVEKFLDTPVKRYSSGMYVRLAFAVAAHLEPEILIVDEVLAVGDAEFQTKCLGKMEAVSKEGRTVLFVSHNLAAISQLCSVGIVMSQGSAIVYDNIESAKSEYLNFLETPTPELAPEKKGDNFFIKKVSTSSRSIHVGESINFEIEYVAKIDILNPQFCFIIYNEVGVVSSVLISSNQETDFYKIDKGCGMVTCSAGPIFLMPGEYTIYTRLWRVGELLCEYPLILRLSVTSGGIYNFLDYNMDKGGTYVHGVWKKC